MKKDDRKKDKVGFNGSFEDLLKMTFSNNKPKFNVGDEVIYLKDKKRYIIVKINNKKDKDYDFIIESKESGEQIEVLETDIKSV